MFHNLWGLFLLRYLRVVKAFGLIDGAWAAACGTIAQPLACSVSNFASSTNLAGDFMNASEVETPKVIRIEASTLCQLRCPTCPTTEGQVHATLGAGFLKARDFERLVEQVDTPGAVFELSNYGEVFLNPEIVDILRIAHERGVWVSAFSGANMNTLKDHVLEAIVKYKMLGITCSIDGASDQTYALYRRRGNFTRVVNNIRRLNQLKSEMNSPLPHLSWQFVVFGHNEHEIAVARALAADLGMNFILKTSWDEDISPRAPGCELGDDLLRNASPHEAAPPEPPAYVETICEQLWKRPQINYDGRVLGCCVNYWGDFGGNAFQDYAAAVKGERLLHARAMLQGAAEPRDDVPCTHCDVYQDRRAKQQWLTADGREVGASTSAS